jgi:hypothetical protein
MRKGAFWGEAEAEAVAVMVVVMVPLRMRARRRVRRALLAGGRMAMVVRISSSRAFSSGTPAHRSARGGHRQQRALSLRRGLRIGPRCVCGVY